MAGKVEDIDKLLRLQEVDNTIEDGAEAFNNSPIATEIGKVRLKKSEIKTKRDQVDKVFVKARDEVFYLWLAYVVAVDCQCSALWAQAAVEDGE